MNTRRNPNELERGPGTGCCSRKVAGASGDTSAQVFALDFHAELVSIAGVYKAFEALPPDVAGKPVRVSLRPDGEHPHIDVAPLT